MEDRKTLIISELKTLLKMLDIEGEATVSEEEGNFHVSVETPENALLIGKHGNTLASLEHILSLMVAKKAGEFSRIILEVGTYRQEREEYLKDLVSRFKQDVLTTGFDKSIRGLKAWERRMVHMHLQDDQEVSTESTGEGRDRVLVIKKK